MKLRRISRVLGLGTLLIGSCCATASCRLGQPAQGSDSVADGSGDSVIVGQAPGATKQTPVAAPAMPGKNVPAIKVDTVGYPPEWTKVAVFNVEPQEPRVVNAAGETAYAIPAAKVSARGIDAASKDPVWQVDFSEFKTPGKYTLRDKSGAQSFPFEIASDVYHKSLIAGLKHFYFQRCRTALKAPFAEWEGTSYTRETACHTHADTAWDYNDYPAKKHHWKVEGGWHDAGNFEMYVPSTAPTAEALLMAYDAHPDQFADKAQNIPESGDGIPDILDEARYGLSWVLSVQDPSGAFRHREAVFDWSEAGPADKEKKPRWIGGVGSASTAKGAAVLALASRVFQRWDPAFAKRAEAASRRAWAWLEQHPERVMVDNKGSEQPLWDDGPEFKTDHGARFLAAAEVWRNLRVPKALDQVKHWLKVSTEAKADELFDGAWGNLSRWALITLAKDDKTPSDVRDEAKKRLLAAAQALRARVETKDGYRCATGLDGYYWGHNSNLLEKAHVLHEVSQLFPEATWARQAARDQWHWVLGRNPNAYSMVTRVGKGPERMYHVEWGTQKQPPPGYLIGGPNAMEMKVLAPNAPAKTILWENPKPLRSGLPAGTLWHAEQSDLWDGGFEAEGEWGNGWWSVTEPDIYYNANLVLVASAMQAPR
ncbi:MAG: glycoside hydrolase family 9 protein [Polyangiaceae bacterium]|nr:glycoside hydrolase family 9 protein [Polyangiaceae bacterium]MCB9608216.1 glycoside hydrolase family 9 protein [Polyangiaceae bacterium]